MLCSYFQTDATMAAYFWQLARTRIERTGDAKDLSHSVPHQFFPPMAVSSYPPDGGAAK